MAGKKISELSSSLAPPLSGVTAVVYNGTTYKSTLSTLRQVLVDSGSHAFTGSQRINGNLTVSGSIIAQEYILSSSITNITIENISGSSRFGNSIDDKHIFTGSVKITGSLDVDNNIHISGTLYADNLVAGDPQSNFNTIKLVTNAAEFTGSLYSSIYIDTDNSGQYSAGFAVSSYTPYGQDPVTIIFGGGAGSNITGDNDAIYLGDGKIEIVKDTAINGTLVIGEGIIGEVPSGEEKLHVGSSGSINIAHFQADNEYYSQVNIFNINSGSFASTDLVLTADNGNEVVHYVNMGINSSTYDGGEVGYDNDAYLINAGKDLYVGTLGGTYHPAEVKLFTMGNWDNPQITLHSADNQISFNTSSVAEGYAYEFSGSAKLNHDLKVDGTIYGNNIQNIDQDLNIDAKNLNNISLWSEGGAVNVTGSMYVTNNVTVEGYVSPLNWLPGQVVNMSILSANDLGFNSTYTNNTNTYTTIASGTYTPLSSSSYIFFEVYAHYDIDGSQGDTWFSRLTWNDNQFGFQHETFINSAGGGSRSSKLFPLTGRVTNSSTQGYVFKVQAKRDVSDDTISITSDSAFYVKITEIAR